MSRSELPPEGQSPDESSGKLFRLLPVAFFAAVCGLVFYEAATTLTEQGYASGTPISNAALYPRLLSGLLLGLLVLQVVAEFRGGNSARPEEGAPAPGHVRLMALTALAITAYVASLPILGFLLATPILVLVLLILLGDRQPLTLIGVPTAITLGCLLVFQGIFNVNLPRGIFGIALNL